MKKLLLLACAALLTAGRPAQAQFQGQSQAPANANFTADRGQSLSVTLDGQPLTLRAARRVHTELLAPGEHQVDLVIPSLRGPATQLRTRIWLEPGQETSFVLALPPCGVPQLRISEMVPIDGGSGNHGDYGNYGNGGFGGQPGTQPPPYPGNYNNVYPLMTPADVLALLQTMKQQKFEDNRLSTAKEALSRSIIRADDLTPLLRALTYDASRVELAKFARPQVADPQNFYRIYSAFQFKSSVSQIQTDLTD